MDAITIVYTSLVNILNAQKSVFVESRYINGFSEVCRDLHINVCGGHEVYETEVYVGKYFYID